MTRGRRAGYLTNEDLRGRLNDKGIGVSPNVDNHDGLFDLCCVHKLLTDAEIEESRPRKERILPCYLFTHVTDPMWRRKVEDYVVVASKLFERGSTILNLVALHLFGSSIPGAKDLSVPVWRPRFCGQDADLFVDEYQKRFVSLLVDYESQNTTLKHAFLPEMWDSSVREEMVSHVLEYEEDVLDVVHGWSDVMRTTGWSNSINRMSSKFIGAIKVHVTKGLQKSAIQFFRTVRHVDSIAWDSIPHAITGPLRPWIALDEDWDMLLEMRQCLGGGSLTSRESFSRDLPRDAPWSSDALRLHLFIVKYGGGHKSRSYLPVVGRGRKFAYVDSKVAMELFEIPKKSFTRPGQSSSSSLPLLSDILRITQSSFNAQRKSLRRKLQREYAKKAKKARRSKKRRLMKRLQQKWSRRGCGKWPHGARLDSLETDGVGLRLCLKVPIEGGLKSHKFVNYPSKRLVKKRGCLSSDELESCADNASSRSSRDMCRPIFVGVDEGRAKPFTASISKDPLLKPKTITFTRRRYYHEMHYWRFQKWNRDRITKHRNVQTALDDLSSSGGFRNADYETWRASLASVKRHRRILDDEYSKDIERPRWRMLMFRKKRSSLERAVSGLVREATQGEHVERPLVFGVGDASFSAVSRGELSAPTSMMAIVMTRCLKRHRVMTGRRVIEKVIWEYKTTKQCCACGCEESRRVRRDRVALAVGPWSFA